MTARLGRSRGIALAAVVGLALVGGCGGSDDPAPAEDPGSSPVSVALSPKGAPDLELGVVVSLTSAPGEGSDWSSAAEGAAVAAYRFQQGGVDVTLLPENDKGTDEGAQQAVADLVDAGVAGIVLATSGSHVEAAVQAATDAGVPVVLPYATDADLPDTARLTGPDQTQLDQALTAALAARGVTKSVVVDAGDGVPNGVTPVATSTLKPGGDPAELARRVVKVATSEQPDSIVVAGPATAQASVVAALQGRDVDLPMFLTSEALSPRFATALTDAGGSLDLDATTVGTSGGDSTALEAGDAGAAASAFFAALRGAAGDPDVQDYFDGRAFSTVAQDADVRSHDAVVALVSAAAAAGSAKPADVADALQDLTLTASDGLVGPALDFADGPSVSQDQVLSLQATSQDTGLRPGPTGAGLTWFASATGSGS